jgi:hypothetical protein
MITFELQGGLGNMLFQAAAAESLAPGQVRYRNVDARYTGLFKNFRFEADTSLPQAYEVAVNAPFEYAPLPKIEGATYRGYFQSEKFMNVKLIRRLFEWNPAICVPVIEPGTCFVHVRRGDYLSYPDVHPVQPESYYHFAVKRLAPSCVLIFSDDPAWCVERLKFDVPHEVVLMPDYMTLVMMSQCSSAVISNSTFSWWGAWLADCPTVAPINWFGPGATVSARDIVPDRWIQL